MWWFFKQKNSSDKLKDEVKKSFEAVKDDLGKVGSWITHIDAKVKNHKSETEELREQILLIKSDLEDLKEIVSFLKPGLSKQLFKQDQTAVHKQPAVQVVQTPVQTAVQTGDFLENLTVMERAIVWTLLNSDLKLSHEDLAAVLGKSKSTIRGQINTLKQKNPGLILDSSEQNGKKRLYIPEGIKENMLKSVKVRVKRGKKDEKMG